MLFSSERDVRHLLRDTFKQNALFIEHARGGTAGVPDCLVAMQTERGGVLIPTELKCVEKWTANTMEAVSTVQKRIINRMICWDVTVVGVFGVKNRRIVHAMCFNNGRNVSIPTDIDGYTDKLAEYFSQLSKIRFAK